MSSNLLHQTLDSKELLELDPNFMPIFEGDQRYRAAAQTDGIEVLLALCRDNGNVARADTRILLGHEETAEYLQDHVARHLTNFGAHELKWAGPQEVGAILHNTLTSDNAFYTWIARTLLPKTYGSFEIKEVTSDVIPAPQNTAEHICGLEMAPGIYIGVDIGRSNVRIVGMNAELPVYFSDTRWQPDSPDQGAQELLKLEQAVAAASQVIGHVDGYAGGSAGVFVGDRMKIGLLVEKLGEGMFNGVLDRLDETYGRFVWLHDGTMMAVEGNVLAPQLGGILGIAMGNDEGSGYISPEGVPSTALHENAFHRMNRYAEGFSKGESQPPGSAGSIFSQKGPNNLYIANGGTLAGLGVAEDAHPRDIFLKLRGLLGGPQDEFVRKIAYTIGAEFAYATPSRLEMCAPGTTILLGGKVMEGKFGECVFDAAKQVFRMYEDKFPSEICVVESPDFLSLVRPELRDAFERNGKSISDYGQAYAAAVLAARVRAGRQ